MARFARIDKTDAERLFLPIRGPSPAVLAEGPLTHPSQGRAIASVNGIDIHYAIEGEGPVVVLVHGLACGRRMWFHQVRALRSRYTVLSYDQRGHGLTSAPSERTAYSPGHLSRDLVGLLDHLGIERCHLVGFSMGGGPALSLAATQPQRVPSLVLADVGAGAENPAATQWLVRRWIALAGSGGMPALADDMLRSEFFKTYANRDARSRRHMRALIMATPLRGLENTLTEVLAKRASLFRMRRALGSISVPTLVLTGAEDYVCRKAAHLLADAIPHAREVRLAGAGHMSPLEAPGAFNERVAAFLAQV